MDQSNQLLDGAVNGLSEDHHQPQPLPPVAQMAYDRYGVLDPVKLDLMIRGIFITREYAATLPNRITADGRPEPNSVHATHHSRAPRSSSHRRATTASAARRPAGAIAAGAGVVKGLVRTGGGGGGVAARLREVSSSSSSAGSRGGGATDVSAGPSDHEKWGEGEIELIVRMKAERVGFRYIAERFPGKTQKAVQEKFYKSFKDKRDHRWKRLYHQVRASHDRVAAFNNGTSEDPIEINSDEGTARQPIEISSGTVSEATTVVGSEEDNMAEEVEGCGAEMEDVMMKMAD